MNFKEQDRSYPFVRAVAILADVPAIMDRELGHAYWCAASKFLYSYMPENLKDPFEGCYKLAMEFNWLHESILYGSLFNETVRTKRGQLVTVRDACSTLSSELVNALVLPRERKCWEYQSLVLLSACCEISRKSMSKTSEQLCRSFIDSNKEFIFYLSV